MKIYFFINFFLYIFKYLTYPYMCSYYFLFACFQNFFKIVIIIIIIIIIIKIAIVILINIYKKNIPYYLPNESSFLFDYLKKNPK